MIAAVLGIGTVLCAVLALAVLRPWNATESHQVLFDVTEYRLRAPAPLTDEEETLYAQTVSQLLTQDLWTSRDMYDASHYLMVPMHYAFSSGNDEKMAEFHQFFSRFFEDINGSDSYNFSEQSPSVDLVQFYYWCCEYLRLCALTNSLDSAPDGLYDYLYQQVEYLYTEIPGNWNTEKNYLTRAEQILLHKEYPYSYYSSLSDMDFFPLASLCDLRIVAKISGWEDTQLLQKAATLAYCIFTDTTLITETEKGGFLFQVGVTKDYPDN